MPHTATLHQIIDKIQTVLEQYMQLERKYVQLIEECDQLKADQQNAQAQISEAQQKLTLLQLSVKAHLLDNTIKAAAGKDLQAQIKSIFKDLEETKLLWDYRFSVLKFNNLYFVRNK